MKEQTTRTPPKLRVLSAFLAVAMLLNLAAPLALASSSTIGATARWQVWSCIRCMSDSVPTETNESHSGTGILSQ